MTFQEVREYLVPILAYERQYTIKWRPHLEEPGL